MKKNIHFLLNVNYLFKKFYITIKIVAFLNKM